MKGSSASASFSAGDQVITDKYNNFYSKSVDNITDKLVMCGNTKDGNLVSPPVKLSYTSYGLWTHSDELNKKAFYAYFLYGQPTGAENVPTTGTATYQATVSANRFETGLVPTKLIDIEGSATFSANFGTGNVETALSLDTKLFNGQGSISADQFSGTFTSNALYFVRGKFEGGFFGPSAQEMGYTFEIRMHNPDPYAGASLSPMDTYISGVAVGHKN